MVKIDVIDFYSR